MTWTPAEPPPPIRFITDSSLEAWRQLLERAVNRDPRDVAFREYLTRLMWDVVREQHRRKQVLVDLDVSLHDDGGE